MKKLVISFVLIGLQLPVFIYTLLQSKPAIWKASLAIMATGIFIGLLAAYDLIKIRPSNPKFFDKQYLPILSLPLAYLLFVQLWIVALGRQNQFYVVAAGIFIILFGNVLPRIPFGSVMGIKLRWTQKSEAIWRKTHRLNGVLFVLSGFLVIIIPFVIMNYKIRAAIVILAVILPIFISAIYSYVLSRKMERQKYEQTT